MSHTPRDLGTDHEKSSGAFATELLSKCPYASDLRFGGLGRNRTTDTRIFNPRVLRFRGVDGCWYDSYKSTTYIHFASA
jgi:hypothetical protein